MPHTILVTSIFYENAISIYSYQKQEDGSYAFALNGGTKPHPNSAVGDIDATAAGMALAKLILALYITVHTSSVAMCWTSRLLTAVRVLHACLLLSNGQRRIGSHLTEAMLAMLHACDRCHSCCSCI